MALLKEVQALLKNQNKKVLVLSSHTQSLFWFRQDMMREFMKLGYQVTAAGQLPEKDWSQAFSSLGVKYRQIDVSRNGTNPLNDIKTLISIIGLLREERPQSIFAYQAKTVIYGAIGARLCGIKEFYPLIAGVGSVLMAEGGIVKKLMMTEYRASLKFAKKVMLQNKDNLAFFLENKLVKSEKCEIINGSGVDTERFAVTPLPEKTAFLCISRLIRDKGVGEYLDAAREIHKKYPDVKCMLVGPFDTNPSAITKDELQSYIDDGSVEYFGEQRNVRPYLADCSVFVLPSYHEGTPKTVLEAMSCGRAVITTDAPGCRETVTDGENGILVPVKDWKALSHAMEKLIENPGLVAPMGEKGRKIAEEKYDVKKVNAEIIRIMGL